MKWLVVFLAGFLVFTAPAEARHGHHRHQHHHHRLVHHLHHHRVHHQSSPTVVMLPHPSGCPHVAFCGCGAALDVFHHHVRWLWLARNWYHFQRSAPAPDTVGVRPHHVFVLKHQVSGTIWMVNDYNSGGHLSRYHAVDISRYTIVNPR